MRALPVLMYHEVVPAGVGGPGDAVYRVTAPEFIAQLEALQGAAYRVVDLGAALSPRDPAEACVALTFDDGTGDHLLEVLPILKSRGMTATFFITTSWVGRPGYLTRAGVVELARAGMSVGSHTHTHPFLDDLDEASVREELTRSRDLLGEWTGAAPEHFSCPGGRTSPVVRQVAPQVGYRTVSTSVHGRNSKGVNPLAVERLGVRRGDSPEDVLAMVSGSGRGELARRLRAWSLDGAKRLLGNRAYVCLRRFALGALGRVSP